MTFVSESLYGSERCALLSPSITHKTGARDCSFFVFIRIPVWRREQRHVQRRQMCDTVYISLLETLTEGRQRKSISELISILPLLLGIISGEVLLHFLAGEGYRWLLVCMGYSQMWIGPSLTSLLLLWIIVLLRQALVRWSILMKLLRCTCFWRWTLEG